MNGDVETMTGSSQNGREFFQCQRCQRFITSGTSTAKRIHNVKCLSEAFAARSSRGHDSQSQLFQGYIAKRFHPAKVKVTKLSAKEVESIQEELKAEMLKPRRSYLKAKAMLQQYANSNDTKSVVEEEKEKKADRKERRRNKVVGKLEEQKPNNGSETVKKKRTRSRKWSFCEICQKQIKLTELINHMRKFHNINPDRDTFGTVDCELCGKRLRDQYSLKHHMEVHAKLEEKAKNSKLNCIVCNNGFSNCASLKKHFVGHHMENSPFACKFTGCKFMAGDYFHLERHVGIHMLDNQVKCSDCGEHLSRYDKLQRHRRSCRGRAEVSSVDIVIESMRKRSSKEQRSEHCKIENVHLIDRIIETESGPVHLKGENLEPIPESAILGNSDIQGSNDSKPIIKTELNDMQQGPTPSTVQDTLLSWNPKIKSSSYLNTLISENPLFRKLKKEHPEFTKLILRGNRLNDYKLPKDGKTKRFRCDYCCATFRRIWALRKHKMLDVCGSKGDDKQAQRSSNIETTQMPKINEDNPTNAIINLLCLGCGYQSTSPEDLKIHLETALVHQDTRLENSTHQCLKCGQWFKTAKALNTHANNIHVAKKNFTCEACNKAFPTKKRQMLHYSRYCRRNPNVYKLLYACSHCTRTFRVLENYQNHEKKCEKDETRPKCAQCGEDFGNKTALRRHVIVIHANQSMQQRKGENVLTTNGDKATSEGHDSVHSCDMILGF